MDLSDGTHDMCMHGQYTLSEDANGAFRNAGQLKLRKAHSNRFKEVNSYC